MLHVCIHKQTRCPNVSYEMNNLLALSQPISGEHLADGGRPREAGEAHGGGAFPQHRLPLYRPSSQLLRPQRPQPDLRAR